MQPLAGFELVPEAKMIGLHLESGSLIGALEEVADIVSWVRMLCEHQPIDSN